MKTRSIFLFAFILLLTVNTLFAQAKKAKMAKAKEPASDKPNITRIEPRGMQRGTEMTFRLVGANLLGLTKVKFSNTNLTANVIEVEDEKATEAWIQVKAASGLTRNAYEFSVVNS